MDIKDLEVRGIVSSDSINCSRLHPEKFYILKNPRMQSMDLDTNLVAIRMAVDVYTDMGTLLGDIDINNFAFGLNTVNTFCILKSDGSWRGAILSQFVAEGGPSFPNIVFYYLKGHIEDFNYNGIVYRLVDIMHSDLKDGETLELYNTNGLASHAFFDDPNGPNGPYFMIDPTYNPNM